ncbi:TPA: hypothetical protein DIS56_02650 [Candidatus Saccharibacteria bacterium]|nr:MAG: hypothetical protein UX30_C0006G0005 [Candidatus Saccharibacteria bacterium GW2011_GWA2_46_10]OGL36193.1 MAG: hypothetical protein A3F05_02735 [Candidatus Saccharibacteria bacterium RIFCSPHIGHO2_12_FULL_47_17]HCM52010.1 hypothetical protein [Candidatus Saccharibacteria bacterium]
MAGGRCLAEALSSATGLKHHEIPRDDLITIEGATVGATEEGDIVSCQVPGCTEETIVYTQMNVLYAVKGRESGECAQSHLGRFAIQG